jgi:tetratricopeptide (TPR) repeat protein
VPRTLARLLVALAILIPARAPSAAGGLTTTDADRLWLHRNLGAAYLDDGAVAEALAELTLAMELAPESAADAANAGVAAVRAGDFAAARAALERARTLDPRRRETWFALGVLEKREANLEAARAALTRCRELGGAGPELSYHLGIVASRLRDETAAAEAFRAVVDLGPDHAPRHYPSALYRLGRAQLQLGNRAAGQQALQEYQKLVGAGRGAELSEEDLELGALFDLQRFERPDDVRAAGTLPAFRLEALPVTENPRWADAADLDGDGDTDLLVGDGQTLRDLRRGADAWTDVTASRGLGGLLGLTHARAVDIDNDGSPDLVRAGGAGIHVHRGVAGAWDPPKRVHPEAVTSFAPVDFDHEGDVDLIAVGAAGPVLLQNQGERTFSDVTGGSGLEAVGAATSVATGDVDDDQDVDLIFVTRKGEVMAAASLRGGRFQVVRVEAAPAGTFDVALGDLNGDGRLDLALAAPAGVSVARNEGSFRFAAVSAEPVLPARVQWPSAGGTALWIADLDNDGRLDLLAAEERGAVLGINTGDFAFSAAEGPIRPLVDAGVRPVAVLLVDGDGRLDAVCSSGEHGVARNIGGTGRSLVLVPEGVENNRDGVGLTVELLAGARYLRADGIGRPIHLGLGDEGRVDALRVRWPNGILQAVMDAKPDARMPLKEKAGLVGSCPFLYTWNGERFEFVTDILTVTPLGLPVAPGMYVPPNWDESIRVTSEQFTPDTSGFLTAQVTEELREVTYLDQVRLYALDHPDAVEVQPNEKFQFPPFPEFGWHVLDGARTPRRALDWRGRDVTEKLLYVDDAVAGGLELTRYSGIVAPHTLTLDFGDVPADQPLMLHLAGWFHWTNASVNLAIAQDPRLEFVPPSLEVRRLDGSWEPWPVQVGFPGGKTKSIPVDLTGAFPNGRAELRVSTTLRIYWDRALLQIGRSAVEPRVTELLPDSADLHFRGHSEPIHSVSGEEPERFDYAVLRSGEVPWDQHPGRYTRYGDVSPLVQRAEDMYVVMASGDECTVRWRADRLPALDAGWTRTFFLVIDGWAKDGDPNTAHRSGVEPWPFHAMSGYPYRADETYPDDPEHGAYQAEWNTREPARLTRDFTAALRSEPESAAPPLRTEMGSR